MYTIKQHEHDYYHISGTDTRKSSERFQKFASRTTMHKTRKCLTFECVQMK